MQASNSDPRSLGHAFVPTPFTRFAPATAYNSSKVMMFELLKRFIAPMIIVAGSGLCDEPRKQEEITFPKWAFCVAYQLRDADMRDARPIDPMCEKDPFNDGETYIIPKNVINDRKILDVAALSTRLVKSGLLKQSAGEAVIRSATQGTKRHPIMECYEPHHLFVFYDYEGSPVAAIEVCFSCNRVKTSPEVRGQASTSGAYETADLAQLARIATEAGLNLKPFASYDAYVQRLDELAKRTKTDMETSAGRPATQSESNSSDSDGNQQDEKAGTR